MRTWNIRKGLREAVLPSVAIIRRELITYLRQPRSVGLFLILLVCASATILALCPVSDMDIRQAGRLVGALSWYLALLLMCAGVVIVPAIASTGVVTERHRKTHEQLMLTLVRPSDLIAGKLLSAAGVYLLFLLATMPVWGSLSLVSGNDWRQLAFSMLFLSTAAVMCSAIGTMGSVLCRTAVAAVIVSYTIVLLTMAGPVFIPSQGWGRSLIGATWAVLTPVAAMHACTREPNAPVSRILVSCLAYQAIIASSCFLIAARYAGTLQRVKVASERKPVDDPRVLGARRHKFPYYLFDPLERRPPIEDGRNPVMVKELRWSLAGRIGWMIRTFYISLVVLTVWAIVQALFLADGLGWELLQIVLFMLVVPVFACTSLTREFEQGNVDMLRTTLLTSREVVYGKVFAVALMILPILLASFLVHIPAAIGAFWWGNSTEPLHLGASWWGSSGATGILAGFPTLLVCVLISLAASVRASVSGRPTHVAILAAYATSLLVVVGIWGIWVVVPGAFAYMTNHGPLVFQDSSSWVARWAGQASNEIRSALFFTSPGGGWLRPYLTFLSPLVAHLGLATWPRNPGRRSSSWSAQFAMSLTFFVAGTTRSPHAYGAWLCSLLLSTLIAWGILLWAERKFEQGRTER